MGFIGVYTAIYDYEPQAENELEIREGDLLYILEQSSSDDWWKAKKKAPDVDDDEPIGLVPNNYVEETKPIHKAKSLYDYTRQTDEEVSFSEDSDLLVYDTSDPDWTLVSVGSEFGFAPSNYIDITEDLGAPEQEADEAPELSPPLPQRPTESEPSSPKVPAPPQADGPAAALAGILHGHPTSRSVDQGRREAPREAASLPVRTRTYTPQESEEEDNAPAPALPRRPTSNEDFHQDEAPRRRPTPLRPAYSSISHEDSPGVQPSPPYNRVATRDGGSDSQQSAISPSGYHLYNISEMVSVMGKRKKMPTTLGINVVTGKIFISPEKGDDGPHQEWTADKLTHYSIEGKHVFVDLVKPSKSVDFHAGAKDTAEEIVAALGEIAGGYRAEGLKEVIAAGSSGGQKKGQMLYDFMAQGDDEVTVAVGDEVIVLDDTKSEEWWMVRRIKNGKEGVVPGSYVEITGTVSPATPGFTGVETGLSVIEQNRLEEERLTRELALKAQRQDSGDSRVGQVGPGLKLPERSSSLTSRRNDNKRSQRSKRDSRLASNSSTTKPNAAKIRKWTDRSGTFTVVAEFIGLAKGKIHLHKQNGVKIAVPVSKMSVEDLEYVEKVTGESLDEDKPLSDIRRRSRIMNDSAKAVGASVKTAGDYDWFDFFLKTGVNPHLCERYAQNFSKDSMDESVLPDISPEVLRTLGLKEGDILRVMKYLDNFYGRKPKARNVSFGGEEVIGDEDEQANGGLFSGPGGALRNNTRKGRPAPAVQTSDVVDPKAFEPKDASKASSVDSPAASAKAGNASQGFDDNAWDVKAPKQPPTSNAASASTVPPPQQGVSGALADLSLLQTPLEPTKTGPTPQTSAVSQSTQQLLSQAAQPPQQPQQTGANPNFFAQLGPPQQGQLPPQQQMQQHGGQVVGVHPQPIGYNIQQQPTAGLQPPMTSMAPRQRPQPPPIINQASAILPPPPQRPLSAPQNLPQPTAFGPPPLQPHHTGVPQHLPQVAPSGQSLAELNRQQFQPQGNQPQLQQHITGFHRQGLGVGQQFGNLPQQGLISQQLPQPQQLQIPTSQPFINGQQTGFQQLMPQPTGYSNFQQPLPQQRALPTGSINSFLPPALQPQPTGINGPPPNVTFSTPPPPPPIPQQPTSLSPLVPHKTGPAPAVRFGVRNEPKKLTPQPTGLKANLSQATPANPFGF